MSLTYNPKKKKEKKHTGLKQECLLNMVVVFYLKGE